MDNFKEKEMTKRRPFPKKTLSSIGTIGYLAIFLNLSQFGGWFSDKFMIFLKKTQPRIIMN